MEPVDSEPIVDASVPALWDNLISLNVCIKQQSKQRGAELSQMEKLLEKETKVNRELQATIAKQKDELLAKDKKISGMTSKMAALRQIVNDSEDEHIDNISAVALPKSVKSKAPPSNIGNDMEMLPVNVCAKASPANINMKMLPVNVCTLCDKKFSKSDGLKRHIKTFHAEPTIPCSYCSSKFGRNDYLSLHMRRVHNVAPIRSSTQSAKRRKNN